MSLITIVLWSTLGGLLGVLGFIATPLLVNSDRVSMERRLAVVDWYFQLACKAMERVMVLVTPRNDLQLAASSWEPNRQTEQVDQGDEPDDYIDPMNSAARAYNVPFGLVTSDRAKMFTPLAAAVGDRLHRNEQQGNDTVTVLVKDHEAEDDDATKPLRVENAHVTVPNTPKAVDLQQARKTFNETHEPGDAHRTEKDVERAEAGFNSRDLFEMGMVLMVVLSAALAAWVIYSNTGDAESAVTLPVQLSGVMLG